MKLYFVVQSYVGFQGSLCSTHRISCVFAQGKHWVECFMTISTWPIWIAFFGGKETPPQSPEISPESMSRLFSLSPLSLLISRHIFSPLPCTQKKLSRCSPVCSESSSSVCWEHTRPNILLEGFFLCVSSLPFLSPRRSVRLSDLFLNVPVRDFYHI